MALSRRLFLTVADHRQALRFDTELRHTLLYYYYSLVTGDAESASHYLAAVADPGPGADPGLGR